MLVFAPLGRGRGALLALGAGSLLAPVAGPGPLVADKRLVDYLLPPLLFGRRILDTVRLAVDAQQGLMLTGGKVPEYRLTEPEAPFRRTESPKRQPVLLV